jgi:ABC-type polysaccharide/polyol phosphate transport system ATPase subunit
MNEIAISVRNLTKSYRVFGHPTDRIKQAMTLGRMRFHREFTALQDVSFEIKKGETVGIIGRNGSGKSTLLQLICGILKPTSGEVRVNGRISALLELGAGFNPEFTGRENVYFQGAVMGIPKDEIERRFDDIASFADIGEFIDQPVRTYSSGMFVRLAFATMIHADADVLVIDEALAVGDEAFQRKCFDKLSEYLNSHEKVLFLVSHNTRQIERVCSRVLWLQDGRVVEQGNSRELCNAYQADTHKQIQRSYSNGKPQPDTADSGELTVDKLWLCAPDIETPTTSVLTRSSARIIVDFHCHIFLNSPDIIIGFHTLDSVFVAAANTGRLTTAPDFAPGKHRVECLFPEIILLPGVYQIRLVFLDRHRRMMWGGHRLCTFQVLPTSESNVMRIPLGLVDIPFEWRIPSGNA